MYKWIFLVAFFSITRPLTAQEVAIPQLINMLGWEHFKIDTTLKGMGYLLLQKDVDSTSSLYQYSRTDRYEDRPAVIRSFMYMDVTNNDLQSRLITYRTYSREEFASFSTYLLTNNYQAEQKFDFGEAKHTVYSNGTQTIRMKVIANKLKDGRTITAYEVELGK